MKKYAILRLLLVLGLASLFVVPASALSSQGQLRHQVQLTFFGEDLDPLVDEITVTVTIQAIRALEKVQRQTHTYKQIDAFTDPDFYVVLFINDKKFESSVWHNQPYVYQPWSASAVVPKDNDLVNITIQLWDWELGVDKRVDISNNYESYQKSFEARITYSVKTGIWFGDDYNGDISGYGRLNGCDDGSINERERDAEIWFDIMQNDFDHDGIPYWAEVNVFGTDPTVDNRGDDPDNDQIPYEWEYKWGGNGGYDWDGNITYYWAYDPFSWENFTQLDPDQDGLTHLQEYLTSQWGSDPFRKDLFVELDQMQTGPNGEESRLPEGSKELIRNAFDSHNIVYHLDDGSMGGSDMIPFSEYVEYEDLQAIYLNYFLHGNVSNWRRGVFHYGLVVYNASYGGFVFWGGQAPYIDSYQISSKQMEKKARIPTLDHDVVYASAYMHECGHTLALMGDNPPGCDLQDSKFPWQRNWWVFAPYKSIMNYHYMYQMVDYSDGSRGKNDYNDWANLDLTFFNTPLWDE